MFLIWFCILDAGFGLWILDLTFQIFGSAFDLTLPLSLLLNYPSLFIRVFSHYLDYMYSPNPHSLVY